MQVSGQALVAYQWDAASRLTQITQGTMQMTFGYDDANRRTSLTLPNGVVTQYAYDSASQATALTYKLGATTLGDLQYTYDAAGNRIRIGGAWARTGMPATMASATYNANNQQLAFGSQALIYDLNGNLMSDGTNTYTWDARNRLAAIAGPLPANFVYDAAGRRNQKTVNGVITSFVYDRLNPVQEQSGFATTNLLTGLRLDEYLGRSDGAGTTSFFLDDAVGSTVGLTNSSGALDTTYTYEAFGAVTITGPANTNTFQYTGRENDGTGIYAYRARYYHPRFQRFLSEDPFQALPRPSSAPLSRFSLSSNNYVYADNSPARFSDPLGLYVVALRVYALNIFIVWHVPDQGERGSITYEGLHRIPDAPCFLICIFEDWEWGEIRKGEMIQAILPGGGSPPFSVPLFGFPNPAPVAPLSGRKG
jgi:RHS repeat-associated protein